MDASAASMAPPRWELYKLLGEPERLRLLALASSEELTVGELADLLGESQPNVSRRVKALKQAGLLAVRKQGTRALVALGAGHADDAVVHDALRAGTRLCVADGSLARVAEVVAARDEHAREFFAQALETSPPDLPPELPAYLSALAPLIPRRRVAVDAGTGDGSLLDVLAPVFEQVIAVDRSDARVAQARARLARRGYRNVELMASAYDADVVAQRLTTLGGADVVFAARVLHHAPRPQEAVRRLAALLAPGGALVVLDYVAHEDEALREQQADLWLGFTPDELRQLATRANLVEPALHRIPQVRCGNGPDAHLDWQVLIARRPTAPLTELGNPDSPRHRE
jgi:ArsR family transcriptional regulator